jgi:nucleotide-binding universal stress UspA family protein
MSTFLVPLDNTRATRESLALGYQMASILGAKLGLIITEELAAEAPDAYRTSLAQQHQNVVHLDEHVLPDEPDEKFTVWLQTLEQPVIVLQAYECTSDIVNRVASWITDYAGTPAIILVGRGTIHDRAIRRLLVPLDGSPGAESILPVATVFAQRGNATLGMVRVIAGPSGSGRKRADALVRIEQERDEARDYLSQVARRLRKRGIQTTWEVRIGEPGDEIARAATTTAADLILMASHQYTGIPGANENSIANAAIRNANIPVIVARVNRIQPS